MPTKSDEQATTPPDSAGAAGAGSRGAIETHGVSKVFPNGTVALEPTSVHIAPGEFVSFVGPSGCGKSTLLRMIAGLTPPTSGACVIPQASSRGFVFQDPTLLPWRTVRRNAQLLLELEGYDRAQRRRRAADALELVGLTGFERSYPRALSGGMKMRLSLARALALRPQLFLMDEPFSALDEITREALNDELLRIWLSEGFTALFVTHNIYEAAYLSNRVLVMSARPGRVTADITIPFEYPRTPALRTAHEFNDVAREISTALRGGQQP